MAKTKRKTRNSHGQSQAAARPAWLIPAIAVGVGALIIAVVALLVSRPQPPSYEPEVKGSPRVALDQESVDFGNVKLDTTIEAVFRVKNVGDQNLRILGEPQVRVVEGC